MPVVRALKYQVKTQRGRSDWPPSWNYHDWL